MNAAVALWTHEQHRLLVALGHAVWVQGALPEPEVVLPNAVVAEPVPVPDSGPDHGRMSAPALARREFQPREAAKLPARRIDADATPAPRDDAPVRRLPTGMPDRLHFALIRAAGINPNTPEGAALIGQLPPSSGLRGDPSAKRALWPRLRALRARNP